MAVKKVRVAVAFAIVAGLLVWLTLSASKDNMQYYVHIKDLKGMNAQALQTGLRVKGKLVSGSLVRAANSLNVQFLISEGDEQLEVRYGKELPDTFKDGSEVLVEGHYTDEGYFAANMLMAKCPSKYESTDEYNTPSQEQGLKGTN